MSYSKSKLVWYSNNNPITSYRIDNIETNQTFDPVNNKATVDVTDTTPFFEDGLFMIQENDEIFLYNKVVTDQDTEFTESDVVWEGKFLDKSIQLSPDNNKLQFSLRDFTYEVFNKFWTETYTAEATPFILSNIIQNAVEDSEGSGSLNLNILYVGYPRTDGIQVTRPNGGDQSVIEFTQADKDNNTVAYQAYTALTAAYKFPDIEPKWLKKPIYEWTQELSKPQWTNSDAEYESPSQIITVPLIFDIQGRNVLWYHPLDTVALTIDKTYKIMDLKEDTGNENSVNLLILEVGEDFNAEPITTYVIDETSDATTIVKERFDTQSKIAGISNDYDDQYHNLRSEYTVSTNAAFRSEARKLAKSYANSWFDLVGKARNTISITIPKIDIALGNRVYVNIKGLKQAYYTVQRITQNASNKEVTTTLQLKEELE